MDLFDNAVSNFWFFINGICESEEAPPFPKAVRRAMERALEVDPDDIATPDQAIAESKRMGREVGRILDAFFGGNTGDYREQRLDGIFGGLARLIELSEDNESVVDDFRDHHAYGS